MEEERKVSDDDVTTNTNNFLRFIQFSFIPAWLKGNKRMTYIRDFNCSSTYRADFVRMNESLRGRRFIVLQTWHKQIFGIASGFLIVRMWVMIVNFSNDGFPYVLAQHSRHVESGLCLVKYHISGASGVFQNSNSYFFVLQRSPEYTTREKVNR